jgi:LmbE family N-acetylglucosaminyl deacetylase
MFISTSRVLLIAPHPDDEALACSVILQQAIRVGAAVQVVYATDGDDNPWPQRLLERKWRLNAADRKRWGRLRRGEALAALRVLGAHPSSALFLALPDQKLTTLLRRDCGSILQRFAAIISEFAPTHLLVPSISDTHPDHSALAVMLRLVVSEFFLDKTLMRVCSYAVHGNSPAFFDRSQTVPQSEAETETKLRAIRCHNTQIKLSGKRFLAYAARPERLAKLNARETTGADGSIRSVSRQSHVLRVVVRFSVRPAVAGQKLFILGHDQDGGLRCASMRLPSQTSRVEMFDCATGAFFGFARHWANAFAAELAIPITLFSSARAIFVKLQRRFWFFDEAGWLEVPGAILPLTATARPESNVEPALVAV